MIWRTPRIQKRLLGPEGNLSAILDALKPQPRGAVTRRAVGQRRSRASGLTRPLAEAIRGFGSGLCCCYACPLRRGMV